jgi:preprotein translocase subunit SecA
MSIIDILNKILGDPNEKELKKLQPILKAVRAMEKTPAIQSLTREDLPQKTQEMKERIAAEVASGKDIKSVLDSFLPEAFAVAIRACELLQNETMTIGSQVFTWNMIPFDVQIIGGAVLHRGAIAEMRTGEGKTLVCTLPAYLNALAGKGVHVVTVNDYLAKRDSQWMGLLFKTLGLSVGTIIHGVTPDERKQAYNADITYGTNNEFGFDYLRDNMAPSTEMQVQRPLFYAIVDEVDSILIDEARTPLIISQPAEESTSKYELYARYVHQLVESTHFIKDEKQRAVTLTEEGIKHMERLLGVENIYTERGFEEVHHIEQALKAHAIFVRDVDYVVRDNEIIIVDEFTGRLMPGRRYSHGLHQAIEAKEKVTVQRESKTLATITFQNYFRLYKKLAGMTGTAKTEEEEFQSIYRLPTIVIPTHRPSIRLDKPDAVYATVLAKFKAVAKIAKERCEKGQPVLIGTTSIEKSEVMALLLEEMKIPHTVLNAKHHEKEAEIVANAGQKGVVTIATNMAGRGTDIKLGEGVAELGGLLILGTERHESRRIDNQLRGRSGRQGDTGESQFFVSMEDELMRLFGGDRLKNLMQRMNVPEDVPLENGMVSKSIESAQKRVEGRNFDIRRHTVQYDDVMNKHRTIMYARRQKLLAKIGESDVLSQKDFHEEVLKMIEREVEEYVTEYCSDEDSELWDLEKLKETIGALHPDLLKAISIDDLGTQDSAEEVTKLLLMLVQNFYQKKIEHYGEETTLSAEQIIVLHSIDRHWMEHIDTMSHLREQVAFSGYAQRDPLIEYQDQGFQLFEKLLKAIAATTVRALMQTDFTQFAHHMQQAQEQQLQTNEAEIAGQLEASGVSEALNVLQARPKSQPMMINEDHVGRNDTCPCGSGKKYKKCHGE